MLRYQLITDKRNLLKLHKNQSAVSSLEDNQVTEIDLNLLLFVIIFLKISPEP